MIQVAVSGAMGRLGSVIANAISNAGDMQLSGAYEPSRGGQAVAGVRIEDSIENIDAQIIVECTHPSVVMENLKQWHAKGVGVVVGTSGFTNDRVQEVKSFWGENDPGCLIVPNFSIGAVLMMRFAEMASAYFESVEIVERHEDTKPDAPSGTALATAARMKKHQNEANEMTNNEIVEGARGGLVSGIRVHSLRMKGLLSDQEVAFSNSGETFSIHHRSTSYESFANGALVAIRYAQTIKGVAIGLDTALDFASRIDVRMRNERAPRREAGLHGGATRASASDGQGSHAGAIRSAPGADPPPQASRCHKPARTEAEGPSFGWLPRIPSPELRVPPSSHLEVPRLFVVHEDGRGGLLGHELAG